ncbi:hypothetical protein K456DRAFT_55896 [Colletotrichum gloeosporioides 23]|nr:hypothetical protein K456DRAFT_55896 [Colletotrichum gloeosporioides 23]
MPLLLLLACFCRSQLVSSSDRCVSPFKCPGKHDPNRIQYQSEDLTAHQSAANANAPSPMNQPR